MRSAAVPVHRRRSVVIHMAVCCAAALALSPNARASAQSIPADWVRPRYTSLASFMNTARPIPNPYPAQYSYQNLDALPNGATTIPFPLNTSGHIPLRDAALIGASVMNGHIESSTPFTIDFSSGVGQPPRGFGAEFRVIGGEDALYFTLLRGGQVLGTYYGILGDAYQFMGEGPGMGTIDQVLIGTAGGHAFAVDNLVIGTPEPSGVLLLTTGVLAIAGVAVRRRRGTTV